MLKWFAPPPILGKFSPNAGVRVFRLTDWFPPDDFLVASQWRGQNEASSNYLERPIHPFGTNDLSYFIVVRDQQVLRFEDNATYQPPSLIRT